MPTRDKETKNMLRLLVKNDAVVFGLEPLHGVVLDQPVGESDGSGAPLLLEHILSGPAQHDVEVHTVDADVRVVFDTQIDMLSNTEAEVALVGEVFTPQLELFNLESPLEDLLCLGSPNGAMNRDLLVPPDTEGPDCVSGLGEVFTP